MATSGTSGQPPAMRDSITKAGASPTETHPPAYTPGTIGRRTSASVGEVLHQMEDHRVKHLPVIDNHRLVGIITEADLARHPDEHRLAEFVEKVYTTA